MGRLPKGVSERHGRRCRKRQGGRCTCNPTYQVQVWDPATRQRRSYTAPTIEEAVAWHQDSQHAIRRGLFRAGRRITIRQSGAEWLEGAKAGLIRNRSGDPYKPSTLRGYEQALEHYVYPNLGSARITDLRRADVQRLVNLLVRKGLDASTVRNALLPLRAIFRRALALDEVGSNPTTGLELPAVRGRRDRFASPEEAQLLIAALPIGDRALWATATYAGLRLGELQALELADVDLGAGLIWTRASWDRHEGRQKPKSRAGERRVPVPAVLRDQLLEHRMSLGWERGFIFGRSAELPFSHSATVDRAYRTWRAAGLEPITLHECRHTFASLMIAAGVNAKALSTYMGHSSITITLDRYGHLMPGSEDEAAGLLDAFLERSNTAARRAAVAA